jgi:hypothetical protein
MGGQPWPELELHGLAMGARRRGRGKGRGRGGAGVGCHGEVGASRGGGAGLASYGLPATAVHSLLVVRADVRVVREGEEETEEREKKRKGRKRKEKNMKKFPNLKISEK